MLKAKSEVLAKKLGSNDFKATDGWLSRWKARHNIKFKKAHGDKSSVDNENTEQLKTIPIDNNLPCYDYNEDSEDSIVEAIKSKHEKLNDDDDDEESIVPMTNKGTKMYGCVTALFYAGRK